MKKILLFIGLFLSITRVSAFTPNVWTDEVINDPNVLVKNSELRYRWYQNKINVSPNYYIEGENDLEYPYINYGDYIKQDFSEWSDGVPDSKNGRIIESKAAERYRKLMPIRYLFFENFNGGFLRFNIAELNILIDDQEVNTNMRCINCSSNFNHDVSDDSYYDSAYVNNGGSLMIDLGDYYGIEHIRIELFMYDGVPNTKKFDLYFNGGDTLSDRNYAHKEITSYVVSYNSSQPERYLIIPDETFIETPVYSDWIYTNTPVTTTYYQQMQYLCMYRYQDTKYRYYQEEQLYLDDYYNNIDNYIKDENSSKRFYLYEYKGENDNAISAISPINGDTSNGNHPHIEDEGSSALPPSDDKKSSSEVELNDSTESTVDNTNSNNEDITVLNSKEVNGLNVNSDTSLIEKDNINYIADNISNIKNDDYTTKDSSKYIKDNAKHNNYLITWYNSVNIKVLIIYLILILFLTIVLIKIKHHNLSYQK